MIRPKITATRCLIIMWAICSYKQFFDLDLMRYFHDSGTTDPIGRERGYNYVLEFKNLKIGTLISFPYVYDWLPLILQAILILLLFVYLSSLTFSFSELYSTDIISDEVERKKPDDALKLTLRQKQLEEQIIRNLNSNNNDEIIQISKSYPWSSRGDAYHCFVLVGLLVISFAKIHLMS